MQNTDTVLIREDENQGKFPSSIVLERALGYVVLGCTAERAKAMGLINYSPSFSRA